MRIPLGMVVWLTNVFLFGNMIQPGFCLSRTFVSHVRKNNGEMLLFCVDPRRKLMIRLVLGKCFSVNMLVGFDGKSLFGIKKYLS